MESCLQRAEWDRERVSVGATWEDAREGAWWTGPRRGHGRGASGLSTVIAGPREGQEWGRQEGTILM